MANDKFDDLDIDFFSSLHLDDHAGFISNFKGLIEIARKLEEDEKSGDSPSISEIKKERKSVLVSVTTCNKKLDKLSQPAIRTLMQDYINDGYPEGLDFDFFGTLKTLLEKAATYLEEPIQIIDKTKELRRVELMLVEDYVKAGGDIIIYKNSDFGNVLALFHRYSDIRKYRHKTVTDDYIRKLKNEFEEEQKRSAEYLKSVDIG